MMRFFSLLLAVCCLAFGQALSPAQEVSSEKSSKPSKPHKVKKFLDAEDMKYVNETLAAIATVMKKR